MNIRAQSPFSARLLDALNTCATHNGHDIPEATLAKLVQIGEDLHAAPLEKLSIPFEREAPEHLDDAHAERWEALTARWEEYAAEQARITPPILEQAIIDSLVAYVKHWPGGGDSPFPVTYAQRVDFPMLSYELTALLRDDHLEEVGAFSALRKAFNDNVTSVTMRQLKRKDGERVYPQDYTGPRRTIARAYFDKTPFLPLLEAPTPLPFDDKKRFETHWIRGEPGTGKSTFLSNMLAYDLRRVKQGCSIVIMDSQGAKGLAHNVARLPVFEPGGELHGRLIYISPRHYSLALNPFRVKKQDPEYINGSVALFEYVLGGVAGEELTNQQAGAVRKILRELFADPKANLDSLERAIAKSMDMPKHSKDGIVSRFNMMRTIPAVDQMLNADEKRIDFEDELAKGKVICIDADNKFFRDEDMTEIYARIFTALILQATQERSDTPEHLLRPSFFYMDEAQDFIAKDDKVAKIIYQARKQYLGMVIANHNVGQIDSPAVKAALASSRIFSRCIEPGCAEFWLRNDNRPIEIDVQPIDFIKAPKSRHWDQTLREQIERYGVHETTQPSPASPTSPPSPSKKKQKRTMRYDE